MKQKTNRKSTGKRRVYYVRVLAVFALLIVAAAIAIFAFDGDYEEYGYPVLQDSNSYIEEWDAGHIIYEYGYNAEGTICSPPPSQIVASIYMKMNMVI